MNVIHEPNYLSWKPVKRWMAHLGVRTYLYEIVADDTHFSPQLKKLFSSLLRWGSLELLHEGDTRIYRYNHLNEQLVEHSIRVWVFLNNGNILLVHGLKPSNLSLDEYVTMMLLQINSG